MARAELVLRPRWTIEVVLWSKAQPPKSRFGEWVTFSHGQLTLEGVVDL
jgi:hypothetical protein